jgi:hypothetical protein
VLLASSGDPVSFNTTEGGVVLLKDKLYASIEGASLFPADEPRFTTQLFMCAA